MACKIVLRIEDEERRLLTYYNRFFCVSLDDKVYRYSKLDSVYSPNHPFGKKLFSHFSVAPSYAPPPEGSIFRTAKEYFDWWHDLLDSYTPNLVTSQRGFSSVVADGLLHVSLESTDHDDFFYHWLLEGDMRKGELLIYSASEDDLPTHRIEFWDAYLVKLGEAASFYSANPMTMSLCISPAIVRHNKELVFMRNWRVTDIYAKNEAYVQNEDEPNSSEPKLSLYFRRPTDYKGEFGFDWIRTGDTGETGDKWYRNLLQPLENGKTAVQQYDELVANHFTHFTEGWKVNHPNYSKNYTYVVPIMTILPPMGAKKYSAKLRLKLEVEEQWDKGVTIEFENASDNQYIDLNGFEKIDTARTGAFYNKKNLEITCIKAFPHDINLVAKAGDTVVGKLKILKNSQLYPIKLAMIKVKTENRAGSEEGKFLEEDMYNSFLNILGQAYIIPQIEYQILDLTKRVEIKEIRIHGETKYEATYKIKGEFKPIRLKFKRLKKDNNGNLTAPNALNVLYRTTEDNLSLKTNASESYCDSIHEFLDFELKEQHPNISHNNTYRLYLIDIKCRDTKGQAEEIPSMGAIVCKGGYNKTTPAHELFHCLCLHHPFYTNGSTPYSFQKRETDNIMDWDEEENPNQTMNTDNQYSLWHWQLKQLWKHLKSLKK